VAFGPDQPKLGVSVKGRAGLLGCFKGKIKKELAVKCPDGIET